MSPASTQSISPFDSWTSSVEWAASLLQTCTCLPLRGNLNHLPLHKLIKIGGNGEDLHLVENVPPDVKYCALSYCWGNTAGNVRTTRATLGKHLQRIDRSEPPKVCWYAFIICPLLGSKTGDLR